MFRLFLLLVTIMFISYCDCDGKKPIHVSPELAGKILAAVQKCQPETGIDANAILMLYDGRYREDQQFKDFIYCSYKSAGFLRSDGKLNQDKAIKAFNNDPLVKEGIKRCAPVQEGNVKDFPFEFFKCFADTTPVRITL